MCTTTRTAGRTPTMPRCRCACCARRKTAGIGLTLLPVLYQTAGFGGTPPADGQRRFIRSTDNMLRLLERLKPLCDAQGARLGLAPHSLRAVPPDALREALAGLHAIDATAPVHIHIAEQTGEVDACLAWSGQRPVEWLLNHAPVDARWCLVHATHLSAQEIARAAATGAVAGICPSTEANLGDGIFDMPAWRSAGGRWGLGSDSHATVNAAEELMLLEYSQRLQTRQRNVLATAQQRQTATAMTLAAVAGGAQASGRARRRPGRGPAGRLRGARCAAPRTGRTERTRQALGPCVCEPPDLGRAGGVGGGPPAGDDRPAPAARPGGAGLRRGAQPAPERGGPTEARTALNGHAMNPITDQAPFVFHRARDRC